MVGRPEGSQFGLQGVEDALGVALHRGDFEVGEVVPDREVEKGVDDGGKDSESHANRYQRPCA